MIFNELLIKKSKMVNYVNLQCVKEGSRLRVKITSPGYNNNANCQFPRAIRAEGKMFKVPESAITVAGNEGRGFFYRVAKNDIEEITDGGAGGGAVAIPEKIFVTNNCVVCLEEDSAEIVILHCGHLCLCKDCSVRVTGFCPMCRGQIRGKIHKDQLQ